MVEKVLSLGQIFEIEFFMELYIFKPKKRTFSGCFLFLALSVCVSIISRIQKQKLTGSSNSVL